MQTLSIKRITPTYIGLGCAEHNVIILPTKPTELYLGNNIRIAIAPPINYSFSL